MPTFIPSPTCIEAAGQVRKIIREYVGRVNSKDCGVSIAQMKSPAGWSEPGQRPEFDEYSVVLHGRLHVETETDGTMTVGEGQAIVVQAGEWVRYSTPDPDGAEYISVCIPAFSPETVHRDAG